MTDANIWLRFNTLCTENSESCWINILCVLVVCQIVGDAVGWGFVVRGSKPCHIQAVDPSGPAAAAGMKVRRRDVWRPKIPFFSL